MKTKELEIWRDIPGYENYQASNLGRIKSLDRTVVCKDGRERFYKGKILGSNVNKSTGYKQVGLSINGQSRTFNTSQIIAITFLNHKLNGNKKVVDHINGVKTDDKVENLRVISNRENLSNVCFRKDSKNLSSKYVGVSWHKNHFKWCAEIQHEGKSVYLGCYDDELEASKAYQDALKKIEKNKIS